MTEWRPDSWTSKKATQQPVYPDPDKLRVVVEAMKRLPPLVTSWEIENLKCQLADAAQGERFLLQGGDCAESFERCESASIAAKLKILIQMSLVLIHGAKKPVIRVGRIAGQYAKPRSSDTETQGDVTLPSYRGDIVNKPRFNEDDRRSDPDLLLRGYERSALTLNFIRALADGGFADLHHPEYWDLTFARVNQEYQGIVDSILEALRFVEAITDRHFQEMDRVDFFTSHEGLALFYEQAQTRQVPRRAGWYNLSTHMPWVGMRTADPAGAHVEYFRGIRNPIGLKVGPGLKPDALKRLLDLLHPDDEPGRLTLIHRFGAGRVGQFLPPLIEAVRTSGKTVLWCADPMHGNTSTTPEGRKTRRFDDILAEIREAFAVHRTEGTIIGGVHLELTGENVTECIGGTHGPEEHSLGERYQTRVDPRLNYEQSLEMAMLLARQLRDAE